MRLLDYKVHVIISKVAKKLKCMLVAHVVLNIISRYNNGWCFLAVYIEVPICVHNKYISQLDREI